MTTTSRVSANNVIPAPPQTRPILLTGGTIHPVSGPVLENAQILLEAGKIRAVGQNLAAPPGAEVVEVKGKHIYPGLIAANTVLGLVEIGAVRATVDQIEPGAINPNVRAEVAVNPDSELFPVTRSNGVLTALTVPQTRNGLLAGTSALLKLDGWTWEQMTLKAPVGLDIFWPDLVITHDPRFPRSPEDQQKDIDERMTQLREAFASARAYQKAKQGSPTPINSDLRWEAMIPVLEGKLPVFIHADEVKQIESAIQWADQEKVKIVLVGGKDAWRVTGLLKARDIPVIVSDILSLPLRRSDPYDASFTTPLKLQQAGVRFCIAAGGDTHLERNLPYHAATAAAYGLPKDEALKAITLYAAQILGMGARLGSLEAGKDATLIVTTGDPLEITTQIEQAYIEGRPIDLTNRQTRLYDKYRQKYEQLKKAPAIETASP
ncbi:amidohydrolase family protein [Anthocerotibacter panamensis]|uniref:amidohydrolase family protein n=1 Tax=Anthocerotibacter panamensis TaxID=2857077 RepID=UPI001C404E6C|nr:amidohydrolase family protein [Anthocerotibacter panamensis]